ncbi:DUF1064 domain-containing protein [Chitinimonas lacunae]|uniref:DUF1064 domain-containing protein n=1 Tax=Chitinimonas lacunae TaxID=1963018 RepID=A0ABV8MLU7_9NEIS
MTFRRTPTAAAGAKRKPGKFNTVRDADGFDSRAEREHYHTLLLAQNETAPERRVVQIERQVKFELMPSQRIDGRVVERACTYLADFRVTFADGRVEVQDVKAMKTLHYIIKRKLMLWRHGIRVVEIDRRRKPKAKPAATK